MRRILMNCLLMLGLITLATANLALNLPDTITISEPSFVYAVTCSRDGRLQECESTVAGLPSWLQFTNNILYAVNVPANSPPARLVFKANDGSGSTTKIVNLKIDFQSQTASQPQVTTLTPTQQIINGGSSTSIQQLLNSLSTSNAQPVSQSTSSPNYFYSLNPGITTTGTTQIFTSDGSQQTSQTL